jgi:penicillin amidase
MQAPDGRFGADPIAGRDALLIKSLSDAVADLTQRLGPDMRTWALGAYHTAKIFSPFATAVRPELEAQYDVGNAPRGGDSYTIDATGGVDNQPAGGSFKIVMDTENWDNSVGLNNPGQSGDVASPHYRDLYDLWSRGKYFPIFYSRTKVDSVAEQNLTLSPGR